MLALLFDPGEKSLSLAFAGFALLPAATCTASAFA
jgi:hypothetical protein